MARPTKAPPQIVGNALTWLCAGALALNLVLVAGLLLVLLVNGATYFWQSPIVELVLDDGRRLLGETLESTPIPSPDGSFAEDPELRVRVEIGNRDVGANDFVWVPEASIVERSTPRNALLLERLEWGPFYGFPVELRRESEVLLSGTDALVEALPDLVEGKHEELERIKDLEEGPIGRINYELEKLRLERKRLELEDDLSPAERAERLREIEEESAEKEARYGELAERLFALRDEFEREILVMRTANGTLHDVPLGNVVRMVAANRLDVWDKAGLYLSRLAEFVSDDPREANTEGGIFPAIFGTVMMVFIMSFAVTPLGVLAAIYLREYAHKGVMTRAVRIAVNNLAGVPSIVFGVFGLGFFVYLIGGTIDQIFFPESLPAPTFGTGGILWASLTLALLTVPVVIVATEEGLAAVPRVVREGSLALGATKFETTWKVVVPAAAPGILTGMILAMARAAGEVAPLMIVGMVKLAPSLPVDQYPPFVHLERKFMHLGFHIYDVGFQSPNVEATKPLVFATALLLIGVVMLMNVVAIVIRNKLRSRYGSAEM
jgi:phosphate transport system permease protein